jgi:hypothetical protein
VAAGHRKLDAGQGEAELADDLLVHPHACAPRVAKMGFDVAYLPPIHPIGKVYRKGRNVLNMPQIPADQRLKLLGRE